ncbi:hypothetical protein EG329_007645 [Mollisiaceae sp. DMI_Dod_QoI]|nr:hypothetical protein EG329_007645 [Helotiales sp. DMI_Dod_QoI]
MPRWQSVYVQCGSRWVYPSAIKRESELAPLSAVHAVAVAVAIAFVAVHGISAYTPHRIFLFAHQHYVENHRDVLLPLSALTERLNSYENMFKFNKKRTGKDKISRANSGESSQADIPSPASFPPQTTLIPRENRRASESPSVISQVSRQDSLPSTSSTFGPGFEKSFSPPGDRRKDPLGLTVIHEPEISPPLDIIFVHGLGGTSKATWARGRDLKYFWPERWLPFEPGIQAARILSFGYNANFAATGPSPITGIADFAKDLLYSMKFAKDEYLEELEVGEVSSILLPSIINMGGLVVKQAYILGQNDEKYAGIVSSIKSILFLATPHRGSNLAEILNRILTVSIFNHSPKLYISELKNGSQTVEALNEQFRHIAPKLDILSFYETLPTSVGLSKMMVVDKASATLGYAGEISRSLNADHHTVCKFESVQDSNYLTVRNALGTLVNTIRSAGQNLLGRSQVEQLETLLAVSETQQADLEFFRKRWTPGTCEWILSSPFFHKWVGNDEQSPTMLWLHALPASGKSILTSFIINHLLQECFCVYYFFRFGDESKRSLSACLRSIAFQIAEQLPRFRRALKDLRISSKTFEKTDARTIWDKIFVDILFKMTFSTTIYWVIDALDESDHPQLLIELMQSIAKSSAPIKVLLVSRQNSELISTFDRLSVVVPIASLPIEDTKKDIRTYVEKEVRYMHAGPELKSQIIEKLVAGAEGNFLWASLALVEVMECNTQEDLDETLEGIPSGMIQLYQRMERTIIEKTKPRPRDQKLGQTILTWATCSRRPLLLTELTQALQPEFSVMLDLKFTITRVCGQFVVVDSTDRLVMVHQTARDHILATDSALAVNATKAHEKLFTKCLSALEEYGQRRDSDRRPSTQKATEGQEFVLYAMTSWAYHLNMISPDSDAPLILLSRFLKGSAVFAWIVLLAQQKQLKLLVYSSRSMNLYVRRKRGRYAATNPLLHRLQELETLESWATDFLKILGRFGRNLTTSPTSLYQQIPPFCPKKSMVYRQFQQHTPLPHMLTVEGISNSVWDDSLAKISLGSGCHTLSILSSGDHFAVLTSTGSVNLYNSTTFELKQTLEHKERVCAMCFSSCSNLLATYGFRTTKVWSVNTGQIMYQIRNPIGSRALTLTFSAGYTQLIIGSTDRLLRIAQLTGTSPSWSVLHPSLLKGETALDRPVHNVPWKIAFNSDATSVAAAYRGSPLCVWSIDPPELIGRCMRNQEYAGNSWTVVDQVIWHPKSEEVIGLYMGGHVFRWNPYNNTQQELQADASIVASSPEGKFFATGDSRGTIKLYNFQHFSLIYQLSCENMMSDLCFSPDSKRLYDLRGQFCNIWEPNALIRVDETGEQDSEIGSEIASIPTAAISETFAEVRDQITAIAIQFRGRYHAIGSESGVVSVVDTGEGDHFAIPLWKSPVMLSIGHMDWSSDGKYLACAELTGKVIVKNVQLEPGQKWAVTPVFEVKMQVSSEGIHQVLLNSDGKYLLVRNGPSVTVWSLVQSPKSAVQEQTIILPGATWIKHPSDSSILLAFSASEVRTYNWDDLSQLSIVSLETPHLESSPDSNKSSEVTSDLIEGPAGEGKINSILTNPAGTHFLIDTTQPTAQDDVHRTYLVEASTVTLSHADPTPSAITPYQIPPNIQNQIEIPLGLLPKQRLIFLNKDYSMCSWRLGADLATEKVQRYYFLPKDWLNLEALDLCALLADGKFLMPNNGELAIIKSAGLWAGLELKARLPQDFVPVVSSCEIHSEVDNVITATVFFKSDSEVAHPRTIRETCTLSKPWRLDYLMEDGSRAMNVVSLGDGVGEGELFLSFVFRWVHKDVVPGSEEEGRLEERHRLVDGRELLG